MPPILEQLIAAFPFTIRSFHSDNGSEYINHRVAKLLEKLRIEQTKSRARQTNDNALVESKNGSTVRKHLGYSNIPGRFATAVNRFTRGPLTDYLNFHRPCHFPTESIDAKGKRRKHYRYQDLMTPCDKLKSLPNAAITSSRGSAFKSWMPRPTNTAIMKPPAASIRPGPNSFNSSIPPKQTSPEQVHPPCFRLISGLERTIQNPGFGYGEGADKI